MANNMMQMLADVPPMLIAGWTAWFIAGGMLAMWYRRASLEAEFAPAPAAAPRPAPPRPRPAARPASDISAPAVPSEQPAAFESAPGMAPPVAARDKRPIVAGDPYGDLATLLDQPTPPPPPRTPGDSPILNSAGSPMRPQH